MKLTSVAISLFLKIPLPYLPLFFFHLSPSSQEETSDMKFKKTRTFVGSFGLWGVFFWISSHIQASLFSPGAMP